MTTTKKTARSVQVQHVLILGGCTLMLWLDPTSSLSCHDGTNTRRAFLEKATTAATTVVTTTAAASSTPFVAAAATTTTTTTAAFNPPIQEAVTTTNIPSITAAATATSGEIALPPMGLGAWAWGDSLFWGYDKKNDNELRQVFDYAIQNSKSSVTLLDTAELYGLGRSESLIGDFSKSYTESQVQVATKFAPFPWRTKAQDVVTACEKSLARLDRPAIDLYQIHFPNAYANAEYWDGLAMAYDKGLVKAVGVSNYGIDATRACAKALEERGLKLATNQIQLSLLYRWPLENGLLQCCQDLGVQVLSYSPLALGMLTGKYTADNKPVGPRKAIFEKLQTTPDYANLLDAMDQVGNSSSGGSSSKAQVALNWARAKGTVPIPGARTVSQVKSNYKALDWTLSKDEVEFLDQAASKVTTFLQPDAGPIPKKDKDTGLIMFDS